MKSQDTQLSDFDVRKWIVLPLLLLFLIISMVFMQVIAELREKELKISLEDLEDGKGSGRSVGLIARYLAARNRLQTTTEGTSAYLDEIKSVATFFQNFSREDAPLKYFPFLEKPGIYLVNIISTLMATSPLQSIKQNRGRKILEIAYFFERKREYSKAVLAYNAALKYYGEQFPEASYAYLHRGFCRALLGERESALADYSAVIRGTPSGDFGITAEILLRLLSDMGKETANLDAMVNSISKGEAYYRLMAYQKAISTFTMVPDSGKSQRVFFFRGRSYEETGRTGEAISDYHKVLQIDPSTKYGRDANRRLYMLSMTYGKIDKLKSDTIANAGKLGDDAFFQAAADIEKMTGLGKLNEFPKDDFSVDTLHYIERQAGGEKILPPWDTLAETNIGSMAIAGEARRLETDPGKIDTEMLLDPTLTSAQRKTLLKRKYAQVDKIFVAGGKIYLGAIIKDDSDEIEIICPDGLRKISPDKVSMRLKVPSAGDLVW